MIATRWHLPALAALAGFVFLFRLGTLDIMPPDEPRYAQVAQEMLESGNYLSPTLNGEPYKEKPPLRFWLSAAFGQLGGEVNAWAARVPSALAAIAAILLTYTLARRMFGADAALLAALTLLTIGRFWWQGRVGQIDMLLAAFVAGALLALWCWHESRRSWQLAVFYLLIAAGMLTKGPPVLLFTLLTAIVFYWGRPADRRALRLPLGLIVVALLFFAWLVPARMLAGHGVAGGSEASAAGEVFKQTIGRMLLGVSKAEWPWYYLTHLPKDLLPWTLLLPWALPAAWRARRESDAMRFLWAWVLPSFVFFTISIAKREVYLLPMYPALAILIAVGVRRSLEKTSSAWHKRLTLFWGAVALAAALTPFFIAPQQDSLFRNPAALLWMGVLLVCGLDAFRRAASGQVHRLQAMLLAHSVAVLALAAPGLVPAYNAKHSVREFCAPVAAATARGEDFDLYSLALFREELRYYCRHPQIEVLMDPLEVQESSSLQGLKAQADLRTRLRKCMAAESLEAPAAPNAADQAKLEAALADFIREAKNPEESRHLLEALKAELDEFEKAFTGERKALCLVEDRDWRWLRAVEPALSTWRVVKQRELADRTIYLIANDAGATLVE